MTTLWDSHVHTNHSSDSNCPMEAQCRQALASGLAGIMISDHYDCDCVEQYNSLQAIKDSRAELASLRERFQDKLYLGAGIELAQPWLCPKEAEDALALGEYDQITGSVHAFEPQKDLYFFDYTDMSINIPALLARYYRANLDLLDWGNFDVLAHLGYAERYIRGRCGRDYDIRPHLEVIEAILRRLIQDGKALEVNTSSLRTGLGNPAPNGQIIRMYRQMGGELITLGSDAHEATHLAACFGEALALLQEAGFRYYTHYQNRKPLMTKIDA